MNSRTKAISIVISIFLGSITYADREMGKTEIQQLFQELTENSRSTWIKAGTIEAVKEVYRAPKTTDEQQILSEISKRIEEYQADTDKAEKAEYLQKMALDAIPFNVRYHLSNEYTMKTRITIKYDGERYYSDIIVDSRKDSIQLPDELKSNYQTEEFNLNWNSRRIFCYDGEKYTMYTPSVNHALIESKEKLPSGSISLLNKGLIPWGYGSFTNDKLAQYTSSAVEKTVNGHSEIHLKLIDTYDSELLFVLDPAKSYAPLSWVVNAKDSTTVHLYQDYNLVSGSWVPNSIVIEKFDAETNKLLEGDYMTIASINGEIPSSAGFMVDFVPNTLIEHNYDITKPYLRYFYSNIANTDLLLAERMAYMASEGKRIQNCATASLQYAALQLGKDILNEQLSELVNSEDLTTSLNDMKKYAENQGFYCKTVTTDVQTLKDLSGCQAILHIPWKNHFVLLDHIDQKYVWIIDLTKNKFYYRTDINFFSMDWTEGTALLMSNQPITLPSGTIEIPDDQLIGYMGGSGYTCTYKIQDVQIIHCTVIGGNCLGLYQVIYPRWGCEAAESGSCTEEYMIKKVTWPCINKVGFPPGYCALDTEQRQNYYILACD